MIKLKFLAQFPVDHSTLPVAYSLILFLANLLHLRIIWLMVSSLFPHNLHLLFCCVFSILGLIFLILMALFCPAIRRDSISLLRFPFLNHVHIFFSEKLLTSCLKRQLSCFASHFWFLVVIVQLVFVLSVLLRVAVISLPPRFWSLQVVVLMHQHCFQCWQVIFFLLFLVHIVCQRHLWDLMPPALSLVFLFFGLLIQVLLWSTLRMVPNTLQG